MHTSASEPAIIKYDTKLVLALNDANCLNEGEAKECARVREI